MNLFEHDEKDLNELERVGAVLNMAVNQKNAVDNGFGDFCVLLQRISERIRHLANKTYNIIQ